MAESDTKTQDRLVVIEQKSKNKARARELRAVLRQNRMVPIPMPGDARAVLQLLTRERRGQRYKALANVDSLTRLPNERFFHQLLPLELARVKRGKSLAVLAGDMQELKRFNDTFGHAAGDHAIQVVAEGIKTTIRDTDTAAHLSGDEFAALLPDVSPQNGEKALYTTKKESTAAIALRMNLAINGQSFSVSEPGIEQHVHMDIGVTIAEKSDSTESILKRADEAMYRIKRLNKDTNNRHKSSIVIATVENSQTVFDRASFGEDGHSIQFERLSI